MISYNPTFAIGQIPADRKEWFTSKIKGTVYSTEKRTTTYEEGPWFFKRNGKYYMGSFGMVSSNGLIFIDKGKAFLFDTPVDEAQTKTLITWVEKNLHVSFVGFVPNHWHGDCMGGLAYIKARHIPSYANQMTIDLARKHHLPLPDKGFKDSLKLKLNDKAIECYYPGAAHSTDNIVVWIPSEKILFAGCMGGFAASTFKRGINYINIPTTLLGAVDAAVGGKTGFNFNGLKNEIGVIQPADAVILYAAFFRTLDRKNLLSGYAEMVKHGKLRR